MSQKDSVPASSLRGGVFRRKGFRILGLGLQDIIRFFFSGNASLAIVFLILICVFLAREALLFFPDHYQGLKVYRKSGQELVDYVSREIDGFSSLYSKATVAYFAEVNESSKREDSLLSAYRSVLSHVEKDTTRTRVRLEDALEKTTPDGVAAPNLAKLREDWENEVKALLKLKGTWKLDTSNLKLSASEKEKIGEAILFAAPGVKEEHPFLVDLKKVSADKKAITAATLVDFKSTTSGLMDAIKPLRALHSRMKEIAMVAKEEAEKFSTAPARKAALLAGAAKISDPEEKARQLKLAEEVVIEAPEYQNLILPLYECVSEHAAIIAAFESQVSALVAKLPENSSTKSARMQLIAAREAFQDLKRTIDVSGKKMKKWKHDRSYSVIGSVGAFIFGKDWVTNSSWHDFYGLLPLFTGSLLISIVALIVAVPFSVAAAIYVNQLASLKEQQIIKPAIEFIGAIPSVVLGFFGIFVLGTLLRSVSQLEWLAWVPGFPMSERLTILNAGLLLAFMAAPTIFTLAEDALDNVPSILTENSLSLGASKVQTVLNVVFPAAISGIIAAMLLGLGRVIGETMVVLLVAGNKIKIPDFSEGLAVVTQPAHTMTGIIAQELGEVDNGSLHWRALFMVGMVLFFISLIVNYSAQKVLIRFQKI